MPRPRRVSDPPGSDPAPTSAGTPRGAHRRQQLVDAATVILETDGFDRISHRAVAARAGLPLAATTYYFHSLDELVEAATRQLGGTYLERAQALVDSLPPAPRAPEEVAHLVVALVAGDAERTDPARLLTFYERYVQAGRHPRLRPVARSWTVTLGQMVGVVLTRYGYPTDGELPRLVVAMIDGLLLDTLIDGDPLSPSVAADGVAHLLRRLGPASDER